jgi:hypothetical protein
LDKFLFGPGGDSGGVRMVSIAEYAGEMSHLGRCSMERRCHYMNLLMFPYFQPMMEHTLLEQLHIHRLAGALPGIPAKPTMPCSPKAWPIEAIEELVSFFDATPIHINPEDIVNMRSRATAGTNSIVPDILVGTSTVQ